MSIPLTIISEALEKFTEEEFFNFCRDNRDLRIERNESGQIIIMSPTGSESGEKEMEVLGPLFLWNKKTKLGKVFSSSAGFTLSDKSVRSADAAWISTARWEQLDAQQRRGFAHICPDFIMELASESDDVAILRDKMELWMRNGVLLAWLIDPFSEQVFLYRADGSREVLAGFDQMASGEQVLPGFELALSELRSK